MGQKDKRYKTVYLMALNEGKNYNSTKHRKTIKFKKAKQKKIRINIIIFKSMVLDV